jgi:hypothetical protein
MIATTFLVTIGIYLGCGLAFALPFAFIGVKRIDPHAEHGSLGFRLLIIPGAMVFWPLLLKRWLGGVKEPPEERITHRQLARSRAKS